MATEYVKAPRCASEWERISREFEQRWNFPNCVGMYLAYSIANFHNNYLQFVSRSN